MGLPNASTSKSYLIIALPLSLSLSFLQPSCKIPSHVSGEQETFNKTSLIEFGSREPCGFAHAAAAVCSPSDRPGFFTRIEFVERFYSQTPDRHSEGFHVSRPHKNRPYCAFYILASGPEVARHEVPRTARVTTEGRMVQSN